MGAVTTTLNDSSIRTKLQNAMQLVANVRSLFEFLDKHDVYGEYFQNKIPGQIDQLTQITLTLGEIYGYSLANETLETVSDSISLEGKI